MQLKISETNVVSRDHTPWIEKYRPKTLKDVKGQDNAIETFNKMLDTNQAVHLLFYGPPGTGKTSSVLSFCNELYGENSFHSYVLCINASYDCDIDMVRSKIKPFCKQSTTPFMRNGRKVDYKYVILDEADTLTKDAQNALRRCIEIYSYNTRFCFMCNYVGNIITPILSRCTVFHFMPVPKVDAIAFLKCICEKESVICEDEHYQLIYDAKHGDLRGCLTTLQSVYNMYGTITKECLEDFLQIIPVTLWDTIHTAPNVTACQKIVQKLFQNGYSVQALLDSVVQWMLQNGSNELIYRMGPVVSRLEKQQLVCSHNVMLIHEIAVHVNAIADDSCNKND